MQFAILGKTVISLHHWRILENEMDLKFQMFLSKLGKGMEIKGK